MTKKMEKSKKDQGRRRSPDQVYQNQSRNRKGKRFRPDPERQLLIEEGLRMQRSKTELSTSVSKKELKEPSIISQTTVKNQLLRQQQLFLSFPSTLGGPSTLSTVFGSLGYDVWRSSVPLCRRHSAWRLHHSILKRNASLFLPNLLYYQSLAEGEKAYHLSFHPSFGYAVAVTSGIKFLDPSDFSLRFMHKSYECSKVFWNLPLCSAAIIATFEGRDFSLVQCSPSSHYSTRILNLVTFQKPVVDFTWIGHSKAVLISDDKIHFVHLVENLSTVFLENRSSRVKDMTTVSFLPGSSCSPESPSYNEHSFLFGTRKGLVFLADDRSNNLCSELFSMNYRIVSVSGLFWNNDQVVAKDVTGKINIFDIRFSKTPLYMVRAGSTLKLDYSGFWISPDEELLVTSSEVSSMSESNPGLSVSVYSLRRETCLLNAIPLLEGNEDGHTSKVIFPSVHNKTSLSFLAQLNQKSSLVTSLV
jgi:hypothetical protein